MHSWKHVISTNAIFHCILVSLFFSFLTLNWCQNCHLFTNQWFIKSTTRLLKRPYFFSLIYPCQYKMLQGMQEWVVPLLQNLYSNIQDSETMFDFFSLNFPRKSTWNSIIILKNLDLFPWIKSWALDFSSNLNDNTNVCNNTERWRSMQLTNAVEQYTICKQSSERKVLQSRTRTISIRQFKYCFSNFEPPLSWKTYFKNYILEPILMNIFKAYTCE